MTTPPYTWRCGGVVRRSLRATRLQVGTPSHTRSMRYTCCLCALTYIQLRQRRPCCATTTTRMDATHPILAGNRRNAQRRSGENPLEGVFSTICRIQEKHHETHYPRRRRIDCARHHRRLSRSSACG